MPYIYIMLKCRDIQGLAYYMHNSNASTVGLFPFCINSLGFMSIPYQYENTAVISLLISYDIDISGIPYNGYHITLYGYYTIRLYNIDCTSYWYRGILICYTDLMWFGTVIIPLWYHIRHKSHNITTISYHSDIITYHTDILSILNLISPFIPFPCYH